MESLSHMIVKCTAGASPAEAERCNQALTVAATAVASGVQTNLWLMGEATWLAVPGRADDLRVPLGTPAGELLDTIAEGGTVTVCTQCAARRGITEDDVMAGVRIAGAAVFVAESMNRDARVLVY